jgi:acyl carrier protein
MTSRQEIRAYILTFVGESPGVPDDFDLRVDGAIDSLRFIQLIAELEARTGIHLDLGDVNPEQLTNLNVLSRHVAAQVAARRHDGREAVTLARAIADLSTTRPTGR